MPSPRCLVVTVVSRNRKYNASTSRSYVILIGPPARNNTRRPSRRRSPPARRRRSAEPALSRTRRRATRARTGSFVQHASFALQRHCVAINTLHEGPGAELRARGAEPAGQACDMAWIKEVTAMPARTGKEYLAGLREQRREIYLGGQRVEDVTAFPGLANGARSVAALYDMQHDPALRDEMTYTSPTTGQRVGLSFITPNTSLMAMAGAGDYFAQNRPEFRQNIIDYYEYVREHDLVLTHTLVNLQRNRAAPGTLLDDRTEVALSVVRESDEGIVVRGPRVLATLGPLADEIAVYPARSHRLPGTALDRYAFAFAIPCGAPGLRFLCRESYDLGRSRFDHPLGSRFEEMDAIVFFDDVLVPWKRVFLYGDTELCNNLAMATNQYAHSGHPVVTKNVAKCEFVVRLAKLEVHAP